MATIVRFEELEVWQMARKLAISVFNLTTSEKFSKEYRFKDQIKSSSGSVMDNIAEGFGRESRLEFINFLGIAKGSLNEKKSQLYRAFDQLLISQEQFDELAIEIETLLAKIASFMAYLNKTVVKGQKFRNRI